jgi:AAA15 family ATPase/GTPase
MLFKDLKVSNFRGFKDVELKNLSKINVIVGTNNTGKTTLLEAFFVATGIGSAELTSRLSLFRGIKDVKMGWTSMYSNCNIDDSIHLSAHLLKPKQHRKLEITPLYESEETGKEVTVDKLSTSSVGSSFRTKMEYNGLKYSIQVKDAHSDKFKSYESIMKTAENRLTMKHATKYTEKMKAVMICPRTIITEIGLAKHIEDLQVEKSFDHVLDALQSVEPSLQDITLGTDGAILCDIGLERMVPLGVLGNGISRMLHTLAAFVDARSGLLLIDEIENGLHHSALDKYWSAILRSASQMQTQLVCTTHSMECINVLCKVLKESDMSIDDLTVYRVEKNNQTHSIIDYSGKELDLAMENNWEVR